MDNLELELRSVFLEEAVELLANAEQCFLRLEVATDDESAIDQIFRLAHNLKGSAGAVGFDGLKTFTHHLESCLLRIKNKQLQVDGNVVSLLLRCNDHLCEAVQALKDDHNADRQNEELLRELESLSLSQTSNTDGFHIFDEATADVFTSSPIVTPVERNIGTKIPKKTPQTSVDESIRVSLRKVDDLLNNVGEVVILQTVLSQQKHLFPTPLLQQTVTQISKVVKEIQESSMRLRMVPVRQTFQKMQRITRDTSTELGKSVKLVLSGEDTELDKTVIEQLGDPLVHLVRNAVDHGLEMPEERQRAGKSAEGTIRLSAYHSGGKVVIEIEDDGKGLDAEALRQSAIKKGLLEANAVLSESEAHQLIFEPGFSTKAQVTDLSGRGVGMDVVKTNILHLQGDIDVISEVGKGTSFRIALPLTLAIIEGMVVELNEQRFVIPMIQIAESYQPKREELSSMGETGEVLNLRNESVPLFRLDSVFGMRRQKTVDACDGIALIIRAPDQRPFSILVDEIICQQQVVIKSLGEEAQGIPGVTGATILGDGSVSLILDVFELSQLCTKHSRQQLSA